MDNKRRLWDNKYSSGHWSFLYFDVFHFPYKWRTDAEAKTPILWPLDAKNWLIWKDPYAGKDSGRRRRQHRMWWWHHQLNGQNLSKFGSLWTGKPGVLHAVHGVTKSWTWLSDWTDWRSFTSFIRFIIKYFSRHSSSFWLQRRCCQGFIIK